MNSVKFNSFYEARDYLQESQTVAAIGRGLEALMELYDNSIHSSEGEEFRPQLTVREFLSLQPRTLVKKISQAAKKAGLYTGKMERVIYPLRQKIKEATRKIAAEKIDSAFGKKEKIFQKEPQTAKEAAELLENLLLSLDQENISIEEFFSFQPELLAKRLSRTAKEKKIYEGDVQENIRSLRRRINQKTEDFLHRIANQNQSLSEGHSTSAISLSDFFDLGEALIDQTLSVEEEVQGKDSILSNPGAIEKERLLTTEITLAPDPEAVRKIQSQLLEEDLSLRGYVEIILQSLLQSESLAHYFFTHSESYIEKKPVKIRTYHDDGTIAADVIYDAKKLPAEDGLNAFLLIPTDTPEGIEPEIKLIFVGTKDWAGLYRDCEWGAPGNQSFERHKNSLLTELDSALALFESRPVKISVIGHSLGGADAQRMVSEIVQIRSEVDSPYSRLKDLQIKLRLETNAAPGLTKEQCRQFAQNLKAALNEEKEKNFEFRAIASIYGRDIVPLCGGQHILADLDVLSLAAKVHLINTTLWYFQHESELYCNANGVPEGRVYISETARSVDGAESPQAEEMRQAIVNQLYRAFRIHLI